MVLACVPQSLVKNAMYLVILKVWMRDANSQVWPEKSVCLEGAHCRELGRRTDEKSIMCLAKTQCRTELEKRIF
jgi:hypothetical protein